MSSRYELALFSPEIHPGGRCAIYGQGVIFDIPSRPDGDTSIDQVVSRLNRCLWTRMVALSKSYLRNIRVFESCRPLAGLAPSFCGLAVPDARQGFHRFLQVPATSPSANRLEWGFSPRHLWGYIIPITCWLSQLQPPPRFNLKIKAQDVRRRPAKYYSQIAREPAVM